MAELPQPRAGLAVQGPLARSAADLELLFEVLRGAEGLEKRGGHSHCLQHDSSGSPNAASESCGCPTGLRSKTRYPGRAAGAVRDTLAQCGAQVREFDATPSFGDLSAYYRHYLALLQCLLAGGLPAATRAKAAVKMRGYPDTFLHAIADGLEGSAGLLIELVETSERYKTAWERNIQGFRRAAVTRVQYQRLCAR